MLCVEPCNRFYASQNFFILYTNKIWEKEKKQIFQEKTHINNQKQKKQNKLDFILEIYGTLMLKIIVFQ